MQRLTRVDCSLASYLAACACGWRDGPAVTRAEADTLVDRHVERCHPMVARARRSRGTRALDTYATARVAG